MKTKSLKTATIILFIALSFPLVLYFGFPDLIVAWAEKYERGAARLERQFLDVAEHRIVFTERSGNSQTIVLIHGYGADKDNWTRFVRYLTNGYRLICPDLPGFGESTRHTSKSYDISRQVERLHLFLEALHIQSCHLVGNSMGGHIAGVFAARYPEMVRSLGLVNTGGIKSPVKSEFHKALEKGENLLVIKNPADFDRLMAFVFVKPPLIPGPLKRKFAEAADHARDFNHKVFQDLTQNPVPLEPLLPAIQSPTLILWGDTDRVLDKSCVPILEKGLRRSTTVIMKDCGHAPMIERPSEAASHYQAFLDTIN